MKNYFLLLLAGLTSLNSFAQVCIKGNIKNLPPGNTAEVSYYSDRIDWTETSAGKVNVDAQGNFVLRFPWEKPGQATLTIGEQHADLFLVKGDSLQIDVDYLSFDSTLVYHGKGAADNQYLAAEILEDFQGKSNRYSYFTDAALYTAYEDSLEQANKTFFKAHDSKDFSKEFRWYITTSIKYRYVNPRWMFKILYDRKTKKITTRELPEHYFDFLKKINLDDEDAIENTNYQVALLRYLSENNDDENARSLPDSIKDFERMKILADMNYKFRKNVFKGKVRDYELTMYVKDHLGVLMQDPEYADKLVNDYKATCRNPVYVASIDKIYSRAKSMMPGKAAPEFLLMNTEGKTVSLAAYKGKTVFIDFWATWCVPCIVSMPRAKALEEKLKDRNDIVFLFVNVNDDSTSWRNYIKKEELGGAHLRADKKQSAELYSAYNFNGIPHYVLIDRKGKIVEANMDSPGDAAEKKILEAAK